MSYRNPLALLVSVGIAISPMRANAAGNGDGGPPDKPPSSRAKPMIPLKWQTDKNWQVLDDGVNLEQPVIPHDDGSCALRCPPGIQGAITSAIRNLGEEGLPLYREIIDDQIANPEMPLDKRYVGAAVHALALFGTRADAHRLFEFAKIDELSISYQIEAARASALLEQANVAKRFAEVLLEWGDRDGYRDFLSEIYRLGDRSAEPLVEQWCVRSGIRWKPACLSEARLLLDPGWCHRSAAYYSRGQCVYGCAGDFPGAVIATKIDRCPERMSVDEVKSRHSARAVAIDAKHKVAGKE